MIDESTGEITGYKTTIGGADTVFPFKSNLTIEEIGTSNDATISFAPPSNSYFGLICNAHSEYGTAITQTITGATIINTVNIWNQKYVTSTLFMLKADSETVTVTQGYDNVAKKYKYILIY